MLGIRLKDWDTETSNASSHQYVIPAQAGSLIYFIIPLSFV